MFDIEKLDNGRQMFAEIVKHSQLTFKHSCVHSCAKHGASKLNHSQLTFKHSCVQSCAKHGASKLKHSQLTFMHSCVQSCAKHGASKLNPLVAVAKTVKFQMFWQENIEKIRRIWQPDCQRLCLLKKIASIKMCTQNGCINTSTTIMQKCYGVIGIGWE